MAKIAYVHYGQALECTSEEDAIHRARIPGYGQGKSGVALGGGLKTGCCVAVATTRPAEKPTAIGSFPALTRILVVRSLPAMGDVRR